MVQGVGLITNLATTGCRVLKSVKMAHAFIHTVKCMHRQSDAYGIEPELDLSVEAERIRAERSRA